MRCSVRTAASIGGSDSARSRRPSSAAASSGRSRANRRTPARDARRPGRPIGWSTMTSTDPTPQPHATAEQVEAARHDSKLAQVLYHDWEAENYDEKWSISYDQRCIDYARDCFDGVVPDDEIHRLPYDHALELG